MNPFDSSANLSGIYKLFFTEKLILSKFAGSLLISSASALCFPLAMVTFIQKDIYNLCKENTDSKEIQKTVGK